MAITVHCDIVSTEESVFAGKIVSLTATGIEGELGIQYGHAALLTPLKPGPVRLLLDNGEEEIIFVKGGYLEVQPNLVTILADTAIKANDIDEAAMEEARKVAEQHIQNQSGEMDYGRASAELAEVSAQLLTLQKFRKQMKGG
jgi:F-type H+-transporting ATPase subunit epsilon|tara:strand:+ start:85470 stop:85898 length:429 start_codon:yes stop_codon:yes gene_type:complete